jgi:hypothetical protein
VCEEFQCLPCAAIDELASAPAGLVETVIELRAYARAKQAIDDASRSGNTEQERALRESSHWGQIVSEIEFELVYEEFERARERFDAGGE